MKTNRTSILLLVAAGLAAAVPLAAQEPLADRLLSADEYTRLSASHEIPRQDLYGHKKLLERLIQAAQGEDALQKVYAMDALGRLPADAEAILPILIKNLQSPERNVIDSAAIALARIGTPAVPLLMDLLKEEKDREESRAAEALFRMGDLAHAPLTRSLADADPRVRLWSLRILERMGPAAVPMGAKIAAALEDDVFDVRIAAIRVLAAQRREAAPYLPALMRALKERDASLRFQAMEAALWIGTPGREAVADLVQCLFDGESAGVRRKAALLLADMGIEAAEAVPSLQTALQDDDPAVRQTVAYALGCVGSAAGSAVPALVQILPRNDQDLRLTIVTSLRRIGPAAGRAVPALIRLREGLFPDKDPVLAREILAALIKIDSPSSDCVPELAVILKEGNYTSRFLAAIELSRLGQKAGSAVVPLVAVMKPLKGTGGQGKTDGQEAFDRFGIMDLSLPERSPSGMFPETDRLGQVDLDSPGADRPAWSDEESRLGAMIEPKKKKGSNPEEARTPVPAVTSTLRSGELPELRDAAQARDILDVRRAAMLALDEISRPSPDDLMALIELLADEDDQVRHWAIKEIGKLGKDAADAAPSLMGLLKDIRSKNDDAAEHALVSIGDAAVPVLSDAMKSGDPDLKAASEGVLRRIGTPAALQALEKNPEKWNNRR